MKNTAGSLPLMFESSDKGKGKKWSREGGHPWNGSLVVGYADGASCRKEYLNSNGEAKTKRSNVEVDLVVPMRGELGWPETAVIAPATKIVRDKKKESQVKWYLVGGVFLLAILTASIVSGIRRRRQREAMPTME